MEEDILWVQSVYVESIHNPWGPGLVLTVCLAAVLCPPSCSPVALEDRCSSSLSLALCTSLRGCSHGLCPELVWLQSVAYSLWALPFSLTRRGLLAEMGPGFDSKAVPHLCSLGLHRMPSGPPPHSSPPHPGIKILGGTEREPSTSEEGSHNFMEK